MNYKLYPIIFFQYWYGSSLCYFISLHEGFYSYSFSLTYKNERVRRNDKFFPFYDKCIPAYEKNDVFNTLKKNKYPENLKYTFKYLKNMSSLPKNILDDIGVQIFPIFIKPTTEIIQIALQRCEKFDSNNISFKNRMMSMLENLKTNSEYWHRKHEKEYYKEKPDDILILDITKLYNFSNYYEDRIQLYEYYKLCDFIKSKPRPEFMNEIDDILWFTEHF